MVFIKFFHIFFSYDLNVSFLFESKRLLKARRMWKEREKNIPKSIHDSDLPILNGFEREGSSITTSKRVSQRAY